MKTYYYFKFDKQVSVCYTGLDIDTCSCRATRCCKKLANFARSLCKLSMKRVLVKFVVVIFAMFQM